MKTSTTLRVTMEANDVRKACEDYMVKHGVTGAERSGLNIEFTKSGKDVTATLLVEIEEADDTETPQLEDSTSLEETTESDTVQDVEEPTETTTTTQEATESTPNVEVTKTSSLFSS